MTTTATADDRRLLQALAESRDATAWEVLVDRHGPVMYRAVLGATGDPELAGDAVQEALLHVRDRAGSFRFPAGGDPSAAVRGWLIRISVNAAFTLARGATRRRARERRAAEMVMDTGHPSSGTAPAEPIAAVIRAEEQGLLRQALAALPERHRRPIMLHYFGGMGHRDMAEALGCKPGAARIRLHRALKSLHGKLRRLGVAAGLALVAGWLEAGAAEVASVPVPAGLGSSWIALIHSPLAPTVSATSLTGGMTLMSKLTLSSIAAAAALTVAVGIARLPAAQEGDQATAPAVIETKPGGQATRARNPAGSNAPGDATPQTDPGFQAAAKAYSELHARACKTGDYTAAQQAYREAGRRYGVLYQEVVTNDPAYQEAVAALRGFAKKHRKDRQAFQSPEYRALQDTLQAVQQALINDNADLVALKAAVDAARMKLQEVIDTFFAADPERQAVKERFEALRKERYGDGNGVNLMGK